MAGTDRFRLIGRDTFEGEDYTLPGNFKTEKAAEMAAQVVLHELEKTQPPVSSGGQSGIQDQVFIQKPDGTRVRVLPRPDAELLAITGERPLTGKEALEILKRQGGDRLLSGREVKELRGVLRKMGMTSDIEQANFDSKAQQGIPNSEAARLIRFHASLQRRES